MKPLVFVDRRLPLEVLQYIEEHCTVKTWGKDEERNPEQLRHYLQDVVGFFNSSSVPIDSKLLDCAPNLKVVSTMSVGYNHFDLDAMKRRNIIGTHTPYVLDDTVADLVIGLMLSTARRIAELDTYIKAGNWKGNEGKKLFGVDVHHQKLGIIGMGRIGEVIAKRAALGFDMDVMYYNRSRKPEVEAQYGVSYVSMQHLLEQADFVVLMLPLTAESRNIIGQEQFASMKKDAIFINTSRGGTVVEQHLIEALQQGIIGGAGLDVFEQEPLPSDHPFLTLSNVVLTPHIGSATEATRYNMAKIAAQNLVHALQGNDKAYVVKELL